MGAVWTMTDAHRCLQQDALFSRSETSLIYQSEEYNNNNDKENKVNRLD
jgi:hypothetical protein